MASNKKSRAVWVIAAVLIGVVVYSIWRNPQWRDFEWEAFVDSLRRVRPGWLIAAVGCVCLTYVLRVLRWARLMRPIKARTHFGGMLSATVIGFGAVALFGRAGEFIRPYLISRREQVPIAGQLSVWLLERLLDMLMILGLGGLAVSSMDWGADSELAEWARGAGYAITAGTAFLLAALFILPRHFEGVRKAVRIVASPLPLSFQDNLAQFLVRLEEGFHGLRSVAGVVYALGSSALMWFLLGVAFDFLLRACLPEYSFDAQQVLVFMGMLMAGSVLQIPGIGGGLQVATVATLTRIFGVAEEPASATAIVVWLSTFMVAIPPALILVAMQGLSWKSLRSLESEG